MNEATTAKKPKVQTKNMEKMTKKEQNKSLNRSRAHESVKKTKCRRNYWFLVIDIIKSDYYTNFKNSPQTKAWKIAAKTIANRSSKGSLQKGKRRWRFLCSLMTN